MRLWQVVVATSATLGLTACSEGPVSPDELTPEFASGGVPGAPSPDISLEWKALSDLITPVRAATAASDGSRIYVLGGNLTLSNWTTLNQIYEPATDTWQLGAPFEGRRDFAMAEALSDGIHLIAGRDGQFKMDHQLYDPTADTWSDRAPLPIAIDAAVIERFGNKIYVIGGNDLNVPIATVRIYDPVKDEWTTGTPMPTARLSAASSLYRGRILVAGGQIENRQTSNVLEAYYPTQDRWEVLAPMPFESEALGAGTVMRGGMVGSTFCVFGGRLVGPSGLAFPETFCYNPVTDSWSPGPDMRTPRVETAFVEHAGEVYAIGGRSPTVIANPIVERLQAIRDN